jgi:hypothetical protein
MPSARQMKHAPPIIFPVCVNEALVRCDSMWGHSRLIPVGRVKHFYGEVLAHENKVSGFYRVRYCFDERTPIFVFVTYALGVRPRIAF